MWGFRHAKDWTLVSPVRVSPFSDYILGHLNSTSGFKILCRPWCICLISKSCSTRNLISERYLCLYLVFFTLGVNTMPCSSYVEQSRQPVNSPLALVSPIPQCGAFTMIASFWSKKEKGVEVNRQMPILGTSCCCGTWRGKPMTWVGALVSWSHLKQQQWDCIRAFYFPQPIFGQWNSFWDVSWSKPA